VILLVGMAVGVDYSLFYLRREREERARGAQPGSAVGRAAATSGGAVLISGGTVLIAMAGMFFAGNGVFTSIALGTMMVVFVAMIGSLSVLPALLHRLGDKVEKGRVPFLGRMRRPAGDSRFWGAIFKPVLRHPAAAVILAGGALAAAVVPVFGMHTKLPSYTDLPRSLPIVRSYEDILQTFPGSQTPAEVVVEGRDVTAPVYQRVYELAQQKALRREVIPPLEPKLPEGTTVAVTGQTAGTFDFNETMKARAPIVIGFVLFLAFLLLLITFRSIVVPLTAIVLNLLSVDAAYGILIMTFQWGHLGSSPGCVRSTSGRWASASPSRS
jgi:RND superfamily putative drug exporter